MSLRTSVLTLAAGVSFLGIATSMPAISAETSAEALPTYWNIQKTFGIVPTFFQAFPDEGIAAAWAEMKAIQFNPDSALDGKTKELIGLAVAAQIPCAYCIYMHKAVARANGATDAEVKEAVAMAAITRHWSTVLNGMEVDAADFRKDVDNVLKIAAQRAADKAKEDAASAD